MDALEIWYPRYPGDYLRDTLQLSLEEDGFYNRVLDALYMEGGEIPRDPVRLSNLLRITPKDLRRMAWILDKYLTATPTGYRQDRVDRELEKARARQERAIRNGSKGGRPKANQETQEKPSGFSVGLSPGNPTGNPENNPGESWSMVNGHIENQITSEVPLPGDDTAEIAKPKRPRKEPKVWPEDSRELKAARFFAGYLADWSPTAKPPDAAKLQRWAAVFDAIFRIDGRSPRHLNELLDWIDTTPEDKRTGFSWRPNILSPETLRQRWNEGKFSRFIPSDLEGAA